MQTSYVSAVYEDLCNDIKESTLFLPVGCFVSTLSLHGITMVNMSVMPDVLYAENIKSYAEFLRMSGRSSKEVRAAFDRVCYLSELYQLPIGNLDGFEEYIEKLAGEMAFQEVFPRSAPNWSIYHIDAGENKSE
jgi:hypothetical protein